jgi:hypothetical protein
MLVIFIYQSWQMKKAVACSFPSNHQCYWRLIITMIGWQRTGTFCRVEPIIISKGSWIFHICCILLIFKKTFYFSINLLSHNAKPWRLSNCQLGISQTTQVNHKPILNSNQLLAKKSNQVGVKLIKVLIAIPLLCILIKVVFFSIGL